MRPIELISQAFVQHAPVGASPAAVVATTRVGYFCSSFDPQVPDRQSIAQPATGKRYLMGHRGHLTRTMRALASAFLATMVVGATAPAAGLAQSSRNSNVIIDYSVLDELGPAPAPSLPRLLQPGRPQQPPAVTTPRAPTTPSPVLRTTPPAPPSAAPGPIVSQPPAEEPSTAARPAKPPSRSATRPANSKRASAKKAPARPARSQVARTTTARKSQVQSAAARGPSPPPPEPKPEDIAAVSPPANTSIAPRIPMPTVPPPPVAAAPRSAAIAKEGRERRFIGDESPVPLAPIPPPPEPAEVARVAPAAGAENTAGQPAPGETAARKPTVEVPDTAPPTATLALPRVERPRSARISGEGAGPPAVPAPPKIAEPTRVDSAKPDSGSRQVARAIGPTNGTAVDSAALAPGGDQIRLSFASGGNELDESARGKLDGVAQGLNQNPKLRLQLLAYAGGTSDAGSQARRLSLSRALSVRSYLIDKGVPSTRIDVRALGNKVEEGPPDRVDVVVTQR